MILLGASSKNTSPEVSQSCWPKTAQGSPGQSRQAQAGQPRVAQASPGQPGPAHPGTCQKPSLSFYQPMVLYWIRSTSQFINQPSNAPINQAIKQSINQCNATKLSGTFVFQFSHLQRTNQPPNPQSVNLMQHNYLAHLYFNSLTCTTLC